MYPEYLNDTNKINTGYTLSIEDTYRQAIASRYGYHTSTGDGYGDFQYKYLNYTSLSYSLNNGCGFGNK